MPRLRSGSAITKRRGGRVPMAWDTQLPALHRHVPVGSKGGRLLHARRNCDGRSRQDRCAVDWAWTVSWMSMNRIDQYPGRGSGTSCRDRKNLTNVTVAEASQMITPMARTHGVDPNDITMRPAMATVSPTYPTRRAQTAILQCPLYCNSGGGGSSMPGIVPRCALSLRANGIPTTRPNRYARIGMSATVPRRLSEQVAVGAGHLAWLRRSACSVRVRADFSPKLVMLGCARRSLLSWSRSCRECCFVLPDSSAGDVASHPAKNHSVERRDDAPVEMPS